LPRIPSGSLCILDLGSSGAADFGSFGAIDPPCVSSSRVLVSHSEAYQIVNERYGGVSLNLHTSRRCHP
jgi:hypothetical protein